MKKPYIALDLDKYIFAKLAHADMMAFLNNESKWDFMIEASDRLTEYRRYKNAMTRFEALGEERERLSEIISDYRIKYEPENIF
ncbi:MAG: hypothetical protein FWG91_11200 [Lachnospiraceae bacterium]|nr:hypothetical protein [Lachnospiraceae bacterium]